MKSAILKAFFVAVLFSLQNSGGIIPSLRRGVAGAGSGKATFNLEQRNAVKIFLSYIFCHCLLKS